jgi:guanine deaminase
MRKIRTNLLTPVSPTESKYLTDHTIIWNAEGIQDIRPFDPALDGDAENRIDFLCLPGNIDLHTHLSQHRIRGIYEPSLLDWLQNHVYPEEALFADAGFADTLSADFFQALFAAGTTTSVIYTAPFRQACELAFSNAKRCGARAFIGMTLMDANSPENLKQTTQQAFNDSVELYERHHGYNPLLDYIFTPRFALSCSPQLMSLLGKFIQENDAWLQTHLSENPREIREVLNLFGAGSYTQVYEDFGLLSSKSILAHAIHLSESEMELLAKRKCKIAHCPDSNFFLKSGEMDWLALEARGVQIGLGSDVAAGSSLDMLYHAKMANYRQSAFSLSPERLFHSLTLGNAHLLGLDHKIGSLEPGKEADLCFRSFPRREIKPEHLLSTLCFCSEELPVVETVIASKTVFSLLEGQLH